MASRRRRQPDRQLQMIRAALEKLPQRRAARLRFDGVGQKINGYFPKRSVKLAETISPSRLIPVRSNQRSTVAMETDHMLLLSVIKINVMTDLTPSPPSSVQAGSQYNQYNQYNLRQEHRPGRSIRRLRVQTQRPWSRKTGFMAEWGSASVLDPLHATFDRNNRV